MNRQDLSIGMGTSGRLLCTCHYYWHIVTLRVLTIRTVRDAESLSFQADSPLTVVSSGCRSEGVRVLSYVDHSTFSIHRFRY
jgi:hypothetical protein